MLSDLVWRAGPRYLVWSLVTDFFLYLVHGFLFGVGQWYLVWCLSVIFGLEFVCSKPESFTVERKHFRPKDTNIRFGVCLQYLVWVWWTVQPVHCARNLSKLVSIRKTCGNQYRTDYQ